MSGEADLFRAAFASASAGLAILTTDGRFSSANEAFCRQFAMLPEELIGSEWHVVFDDGSADAAALGSFLRRPGAADVWSGTLSCGVSGDSHFPLHVSCAPVVQNGSAEHVIVFVAPQLVPFADARPEAQMIESVALLAGGVAHEINNPLMGLMGFAQLLEDRVASDGAAFVASILEQAERIRVIAAQLLAFSERSGRDFLLVDPCSVVAPVLERFEAICGKNGLEFHSTIPESGLTQVRCHPALIAQALVNLLENSRLVVSELPNGDPRRWLSLEVSVTLDGPAAKVRFTVQDGGGGHPGAEQAALFAPLSVGRESSGEARLRLAIARRIVQRHGSRIRFESPGSGRGAYIFELAVGTGSA